MEDYKAIFKRIEKTLKAQSSLSEEEFNLALSPFKNYVGRELLDNEVFHILVMVTFYSGMKATTVNRKERIIKDYFPGFMKCSTYGEADIQRMMSDKKMIKNERKIRACVSNARTFREIVERHGSFQQYLKGFKANDSFENLILLKEELQYKFHYLGEITAYHFLTDLGYNVLKPDRVIQRLFQRLGLIEDAKQLLKSVIVGRKMVDKPEKPIRYIDMILVKYGQQGASEPFGIENGICLQENPRCGVCGVYDLCKFEGKGLV